MNLNIEQHTIESLKNLLNEVLGLKDAMIQLKAPKEILDDFDERITAINNALKEKLKKQNAAEGHTIPKQTETPVMTVFKTQKTTIRQTAAQNKSSGSYKVDGVYFSTLNQRRKLQKLERDLQEKIKQFLLLKNKEKHKSKYFIIIKKRLDNIVKFISENAIDEQSKKCLFDKKLSAWVKGVEVPLNDKLFKIIGIN
jgi:hypothetical protein